MYFYWLFLSVFDPSLVIKVQRAAVNQLGVHSALLKDTSAWTMGKVGIEPATLWLRGDHLSHWATADPKALYVVAAALVLINKTSRETLAE